MATPAWPEELLGAPGADVPGTDWANIRSRTGLEFPADYRQLARLYPALIIDDVLIVWHPAGPPGFNLLDSQGALDQLAAWGPPEEIEEYDPGTGKTRTLDPPGLPHLVDAARPSRCPRR